MKKTAGAVVGALALGVAMSASVQAGEGLINVKSQHSVAQTADKLENILNEKGMTVFARINHSAGAKKIGQELRDTELVLFGNPQVGTPLMQCAQTVGIDLPQKALVWKDEEGSVWLSYNDPAHLAVRHNMQGCDEVITKVSGALGKFAKAATE